MIRVDKMDVFAMVVEAIERDDPQTASALMQIISKALKNERKKDKFSEEIVINNKKDEKLIKQLLDTNAANNK